MLWKRGLRCWYRSLVAIVLESTIAFASDDHPFANLLAHPDILGEGKEEKKEKKRRKTDGVTKLWCTGINATSVQERTDATDSQQRDLAVHARIV